MPVPLHVRSHHTAASWGGGTRERPAPGWPPSRCAHTLPKQNPPGTRVHDIEACVCGYGRYTAGACSWGLGCPLLVKTARVACCEEWRCSFLVHRASSAPACDSARSCTRHRHPTARSTAVSSWVAALAVWACGAHGPARDAYMRATKSQRSCINYRGFHPRMRISALLGAAGATIP